MHIQQYNIRMLDTRWRCVCTDVYARRPGTGNTACTTAIRHMPEECPQVNSSQVDSSALKSTQAESSQFNTTEVNSTQLKPTQLGSTKLNKTQVRSSQDGYKTSNSTFHACMTCWQPVDQKLDVSALVTMASCT